MISVKIGSTMSLRFDDDYTWPIRKMDSKFLSSKLLIGAFPFHLHFCFVLLGSGDMLYDWYSPISISTSALFSTSSLPHAGALLRRPSAI